MSQGNQRLVLSRTDVERLRAILGAHDGSGLDRDHLSDLRDEIEQAYVVADEDFPARFVRLGSEVRVRDSETRAVSHYTIVSPSQANVASNHISVLAPLGTALLGYGVGDEVEWHMPGGVRRLRIEWAQLPPRSDLEGSLRAARYGVSPAAA